MNNIWEFLLQTLTVSLTAGLLLLVKQLFMDKLSPRWQYGIWSVLVLRILLPVNVTRYLLLPLPLWTELGKVTIEKRMSSAYSKVYSPLDLEHTLPVIRSVPESITDWLFVIYMAGIVVSLCWYFISYLRLRMLLNRAMKQQVTEVRKVSEVRQFVERVCAQYAFGKRVSSVKTVTVPGISTAFVCGVFRPMLVLPDETAVDEKILLHELLHLKYCDALQSIGWCILRSLHWCNPWLQYIFDRIGNDMEALCDQRVLERLEGEERREYGNILLSMANEKYARMPGTTSISNGGENIARRIAYIVRFKKYPKGMSLVSVCIVLVLAVPVMVGEAAEYGVDEFYPSAEEMDRAMAITRLKRCGTPAGAIDTYAKGLLLENGIYMAMASPLEQQEALAARMQYHSEVNHWGPYHIDSGEELTDISANPQTGYTIYNIKEVAEGEYEAILGFESVMVPIKVRYEDGWVVAENGERWSVTLPIDVAYWPANDMVEPLQEFAVTGETGTVKLKFYTTSAINNSISDTTPNPDAEFNEIWEWYVVEYICTAEEGPQNSVGVQMIALESLDEEVEFPQKQMSGNKSGSGDNCTWVNRTIDAGWDGRMESSGGGTRAFGEITLPAYEAVMIRIFWDGRAVEELCAIAE